MDNPIYANGFRVAVSQIETQLMFRVDTPRFDEKDQMVAIERKDVADGYARNFLLKRNLAVLESEGSKKVLEKQKEEAAKLDAQKRKEAEELKTVIEATTLEFKVKAKEGKVSGSVSTKQIEDELKKQDIIIDKRKIKDNVPLNELGTYNVKVELYKDVVANIKVILTEETK